MPKIKPKKTLLKRVKITKNGKILKKNSRIGHLRSKWDSSSNSRKKKLKEQMKIGQVRVLKRLLAQRGRGVNKQ